MRALVCPDSFKGSLTSREVAVALARGFVAEGWDVCETPLADGGEGTAEVIASALGGRRVPSRATDPLGRAVDAAWWSLDDGDAAVVEVAEASGLWRVESAELDATAATSRGTGELIVEASRHARTVLVGVGGSATTDGGADALDAIDKGGGIGDARLICLCDVRTSWEESPRVFGPQKGATAPEIASLEARLMALGATLPRDPRGVPMTGAAGGLAGGLWAELDATLQPGAAHVCDLLALDERIAEADLVVSGEGALDDSTLEGKVVAEVAMRCRAAGKPLHVVTGRDDSDERIRSVLGLSSVAEAGGPQALAGAAAGISSGA